MLELLRLLLLLLAYHLHTLTATVTWKSSGPNCYLPELFNNSNLRRDCFAAMSLVPNTGLAVDPDDMEKSKDTANLGLNHGSVNIFSLRLIGKDTCRVNGDKIRLPAVFYSGDCLVSVKYIPSMPRNDALFQHIYVWPTVHKLGEMIIDSCFVKTQELEQFGRQRSLWPRIIGTSRANIHTDQGAHFTIHTSLQVKENTAEHSSPCSSREEKILFRDHNVYTTTGQINDNRWETPFQRPPQTAKTKLPHPSKPKRKFRDAMSP